MNLLKMNGLKMNLLKRFLPLVLQVATPLALRLVIAEINRRQAKLDKANAVEHVEHDVLEFMKDRLSAL